MSGAFTAEPKQALIPQAHSRILSASDTGIHKEAMPERKSPAMPPIIRIGEKIPPQPPHEWQAEVAASLARRSRPAACQAPNRPVKTSDRSE